MLASLSWWLVIQLFSAAALPLAWRLFARLPGRGYGLSKALGLLLVSYILWMGASLRLLPNTIGGITVAILALAGISLWLGRDGLRRAEGGASPRPLVAWLRRNWGLVLTTELLFALVFAAWTAFRAYNGEIAGTEKPMEFAFINGILCSRFFPPQDPWLSGYAISYYYFGYVMLGLLIRLTGVDPAVGFNLGVALWYALTMVGAFSVAFDLVRLSQSAFRNLRSAIGFGLLGALFVGFIGNLEGVVEAAYQRGLAPLAWIKWLDIKQLTDAPPTGGWTGGFWWWWRASRVIHDRDLLGNSVEVIDEFPFFSFLLGDMHPHVLALPFVLLAIACALNLLLAARDFRFRISDFGLAGGAEDQSAMPGTAGHTVRNLQSAISRLWQMLGECTGLGGAGILLYALAFGALGFLNTWDFPIYVALATVAIGAGLASAEGLTWAAVQRAAAAGLALGVLGWLLYLPFYIGFQSQLGGVLPNLLFPSRFSQFVVMFGLFLAVMLPYLILMGRAAPGRVWRRGTLFVFPWVFLAPLLLLAAFVFVFVVLPPGQAFIQTVLDNPAVKAAVGDRSFGQLVGLTARLRVANPWTYLALAALLSWVAGLLWAALSAWPVVERNDTTGRQPPAISDIFVLLMVGLAFLLTFGVEFVYLRDLFGTRMNTVFKFYYQAWVLLALASAYGLSRLTGRAASWALKAPVLALTLLLVAASLFYPFAAIPSKAGEFRSKPTLDGLTHLRQGSPADVAAIEWLRANVPPSAVVVEASGGSYSPEGAGRISMSTGYPTLLGWDFHERQWRGAAYDKLAAGRPEALDQIYRTARSEDLPGVLDKWHVDYVIVGQLERRKFGLTDPALARFDRALRRVYDKDGVRIYAR
jgi:YYY domain-containing protein